MHIHTSFSDGEGSPAAVVRAARARGLSKEIRSGRLFPPDLEKGLAGELQSAGERAGLALEAWAVRLEEMKSRGPGGSFVLGEDTLAALLREKEGIYTPPRELLLDLESRERALRRELTKILGEEPSAPALETLAEKPLAQPKGVEIPSLSPSWARRFCKAKRILPGPLPESPGSPLSSPLLEDLAFPTWRPGDNASPPTADRLLRLARATWPGFQALRTWLRRNDSPLRKMAPSLLFCRGWLSYAETLWAEKDPHPALRTVQAWRRLVECVQARTALGLHMGNLTLSQAAGFLRERAFLPPGKARSLALALARVPLRYLGYLGLQSIGELRASCLAREGKAFAAGAFNGKVLSCGALPAGAMEVEILLYCETPASTK